MSRQTGKGLKGTFDGHPSRNTDDGSSQPKRRRRRSSTPVAGEIDCRPPFNNWYLRKHTSGARVHFAYDKTISYWRVHPTTTNPMNLEKAALITQEHLIHVWRRSNSGSPNWLVGGHIVLASIVDYFSLPILPKSFPYSNNPLGRPFAFVNMFDPYCKLTRAPPVSSRGIYAILVQLPHAHASPWKIPIEVAAFLFNQYRSKKYHNTCFDLTSGEMKVDTDTPHRPTAPTVHDVVRPLGYPKNNVFDIQSIDD